MCEIITVKPPAPWTVEPAISMIPGHKAGVVTLELEINEVPRKCSVLLSVAHTKARIQYLATGLGNEDAFYFDKYGMLDYLTTNKIDFSVVLAAIRKAICPRTLWNEISYQQDHTKDKDPSTTVG